MKEDNYLQLLSEVKIKIREAQIKTVVAANNQMLLLYWQLGNYILSNQHQKGWGSKVIDQLAADLKNEFPLLKGFSSRNLKYMRNFANSYPVPVISKMSELEEAFKQKKSFVQQLAAQLEETKYQRVEIVQPPVAQLEDTVFLQSVLSKISWSHHVVLIDKEPDLGKRFWYMLNTLEHGNSRDMLALQIESGLYERQITAKKVNNFERTLPKPQTDFANYLLKDPYIFDYVQASEKTNERSIEEQLSSHITKFLLELGQGFSFVGRQCILKLGTQIFMPTCFSIILNFMRM